MLGRYKCLLAMAGLAGTVSLAAQTYYISPAGNDTNDGLSVNKPWASFHHAQYLVAAGDVLVVRGGVYADQSFIPQNPGQAGKPVTIQAARGEIPVLTGHSTWSVFFAIYQPWFVIDGLHFENTLDGSVVLNARMAPHLTIRNCTFRHNLGTTQVLLDQSDYAVIEDNVFDTTGTTSGEGEGDNIYVAGSRYALIENNRLGNAGHAAVDFIDETVPSTHCIIRRNLIDQTHGGGGIYVSRLSSDIVIDGNTIVNAGSGDRDYPKAALMISAARVIARLNVIRGTSLSPADNGIALYSFVFSGRTQNAVEDRIYNNTVYGAGHDALYISVSGQTKVTGDKIVNNILYRNHQVGSAEPYFPAGYYAITVETYHANPRYKWTSFPNGNYFLNNLILHANGSSDDPGIPIFYYDQGNWSKSLAQLEAAYPGFFHGNIEENPLFENAARGDFRLARTSPARGAGANLAVTTAAGNQTTLAPVDDPYFFTDGYGIASGDRVKIGNGPIVTVTAVDNDRRTLTVSAPVSFAAGAPVNLPYSGARPDIGAGQER